MSTPNQPGVHLPYTITNVRETQTFGPANQLEDVLEVTFTSDDHGGSYTVRVPVNQADPAALDNAIERRLEQIKAIHSLGPQPHPANEAP